MRVRHGPADNGTARTRIGRGPRLVPGSVLGCVLGCVLAAALLAGCAPRVHVQGHVTDPEALAQIEPGVQSRAEVAQLLGTPSAVATFDDKRWYYITRRTEQTAFYDPELIEQDITVIAFDEAGTVAEVSSFAAEQARAIDPVDAESPTRGSSFGLFEQILGNIGRPIPRSDQ